MSLLLRKVSRIALAIALLFGPVMATAGTMSNTVSVGLSYNVGESITVQASPASVTFTGAVPTTGPVIVSTSWNLTTAHVGKNLDTYFYFATTAALTDATGDNISASNVMLNVNGGSMAGCGSNPNGGAAGNGGGVVPQGSTCSAGFETAITGSNLVGSHGGPVVLQLQNFATLPAGSYTGVLNITAGVL